MSDKPVVSHNEATYGQRRQGRFRRHCARFWWLHLCIFILVAVLVVLLIIFVAVPKIAQSKLDSSGLTVQGISSTNTQSDNYTLSINSTLTSDGSVHANIDAFTGVMYLSDTQSHTPFATIDFPPTTADALQVVNISQFAPINNMAAFTQFNTWLLLNDSVDVTIEGDTNVHVSGISHTYGVHYQKTVTMPGLRNFEGTTVTNVTIDIGGDPNADNFHATTTIPNYSFVTFEIGNATFHNYLLGAEIGTVYIDNMILRPGNNSFAMRSNVNQATVLQALTKQPYCQNGTLPFQLLGKSVVNHNQPLSYFTDSLSTANQTVWIDIATPLKQQHNLTITCSS